MVALSPGVAIDIAHDDISDGLASIAELAGQGSSIQTQFELTHDNVDPATVKVTVNGQAATFTIEGNVVTVTSNIPAGATVAIDFCLKGKAKCNGHHHNHRKCRPLHWWKNCWQYKGGKWCYKWNHSDCNKEQNGGSKHNTKNPCKNNTGSSYGHLTW